MTNHEPEGDHTNDDGPECETCGKSTCPDADLPGFSEPVNCLYAPIYHALKDAKDCDYGCARDYTNQAVRLWVVGAVESIVAGRLSEARAAALREAASGVSNDIWSGVGPDLHQDHYPALASVRAWLEGRADRELEPRNRPVPSTPEEGS